MAALTAELGRFVADLTLHDVPGQGSSADSAGIDDHDDGDHGGIGFRPLGIGGDHHGRRQGAGERADCLCQRQLAAELRAKFLDCLGDDVSAGDDAFDRLMNLERLGGATDLLSLR